MDSSRPFPKKMSLECITGPMCSGKTSAMLKKMTLYADCVPSSSCLIINSSLDVREQKSGLSSHSSGYRGISSKISVVSSQRLSDVEVGKYTHVGVDECQFYADLKDSVEHWLKAGIHVVVCGLDGTSEMKAFGQIADLLPLADEFVKLNATCSLCVKESLAKGDTLNLRTLSAPFTKKLDSKSSKVIDIGGTDKYLAVCRKHFNEKTDSGDKNDKGGKKDKA